MTINVMGIIKKKIEKEITFFMFENFTSKTLDDLLCFCGENSDWFISNIKIELTEDGNPHSIQLGINEGGVLIYHTIKQKTFHYFKGNELKRVENVDEVVWW